MNINFDKQEREIVAEKLVTAGLEVSEERINNVLANVEASYWREFANEAQNTVLSLLKEEEDEHAILIYPKKVAAAMSAQKRAGTNDGWTNCFTDTLESLYHLESEVQKNVGMDSGEFASTYEPGGEEE